MAFTWNPSDKSTKFTLSNGNLTVVHSGSQGHAALRATGAKSGGKPYWEERIDHLTNSIRIGFGTSAASLSSYLGAASTSYGYRESGYVDHDGGNVGPYGSFSVNDVIGIALDLVNEKVWWAINNVWQNSGDPANGTNPIYTGVSGTFYPMYSDYRVNDGCTGRFLSSDQSYSPPSGFSPIGGFPPEANLFNGKVRIKNITTNSFDSKVQIKDVIVNLFDGRVFIGLFVTGLFDGKLQIKDEIFDLFDGKVQIKDVAVNLFDGKVFIGKISTNPFDGKAQIKDSAINLFDGKTQIKDLTTNLFDGKAALGIMQRQGFLGGFGEPGKIDFDLPLSMSSGFKLSLPLGLSTLTYILTGLGETLEYLLHTPMAQTELQQITNHLSEHINAIQILINNITSGDPLSGRQPLLTSIQSESGIHSLVNELSGILAGAQKLLTALTEGVSNHVSFINELALKNDIQSLLVLLGSMPDQVAAHISPKLGVPLEGAPPSECAMCIYLDGVPINNQITDLSFVMDREVTFDVLSFSSSDVQLYAKLQEIVGNKDSTLEIQYRGTSWFFLIEEVSGYELSYNVWGRSIAAAKSDAPFEDSISFVLGADTQASVVAEDLVPNLSVIWNVVDWTVMAGWSADGTPVQMLKELADSVGAVVRSYPDGTGFYVEEKYTTRPVDLLYAASIEDYDRDVDLISLDASRDLGTGANAVTVHGYSPFNKYSIRLEADSCVDVGNPAIIKVYPALEGIGYRLVASEGVPIYQHSLSEEHVEVVSFVGGKSSVSYPITSLKSITWDGAAPAGFEHTPGQNEIVLTDDTLAAVGEVAYSTRYDVWYGIHSGEGQLLIICYLDEGGGIIAKVYFGEGNHEADDIDRPILTSIEAAMAAGQAFLDDTSYNRLLRMITVPCSNVSDGDVISVLSDLSGVIGNTFVLRHEISAKTDNEALKIISNLNVVQFEV